MEFKVDIREGVINFGGLVYAGLDIEKRSRFRGPTWLAII
jgi:hypothetical protein